MNASFMGTDTLVLIHCSIPSTWNSTWHIVSTPYLIHVLLCCINFMLLLASHVFLLEKYHTNHTYLKNSTTQAGGLLSKAWDSLTLIPRIFVTCISVTIHLIHSLNFQRNIGVFWISMALGNNGSDIWNWNCPRK